MAPAQDYKRIFDGDEGPNTGGMGSYSPVPGVDADAPPRSRAPSTSRSSTSCARRGTPFHGVLYAGLMLTADGPQVLEFNVRFGDPETQAVLPRLRSDLLDLLERAATPGGLDRRAPRVGRALGGHGRPGQRRLPRVGLEGRRHRGPRRGCPARRGHPRGDRRERGGDIVTAGGRVLNVTALGATPAAPATPPMLPPT